ncbi:MAG TPA: glycosyltransferase family 4 protein [Anaerolineae bacterium]|nr:glycosyltransferase family 4 protein [Anaerolineae bacterium]
MNILILSHLYPTPHDPSFGIFIHQQIQYLRQLGHQVTVLAPIPWSPRIFNFRPKWRNYYQTPARHHWGDFDSYYPRYLRLPGAWFRAFAGLSYYHRVLAQILALHHTQPYDLIHSHMLLPDGLAAIFLGRELGLPTVCTMHGSDALHFPYENSLNRHASNFVLRYTDQMIAVSQAMQLEVEQQLAATRRPIRVVRYGVNSDLFQNKPASSVNQPTCLNELTPYILFVGRDIKRKGLLDLLIAFERVMKQIDHNLVIIGPTWAEVEQLAPALIGNLQDRLKIAGRLPHEEVASYMQACEFFVLPSYLEGLPNVILEAMACGKAVVSTDVAGIPEQVVGNVTGYLVQPGDIPALTEAICDLAQNPDRCREMGQHGQTRVLTEFTWQSNVQTLLSIYKMLLSRS